LFLLLGSMSLFGTSLGNEAADSLFHFPVKTSIASARLATNGAEWGTGVSWQTLAATKEVPFMEDSGRMSFLIDRYAWLDSELPVTQADTESVANQSAGILWIGMLVTFILIGDQLRGHVHCREYLDLREHLLIASRNLTRAHENWLIKAGAVIDEPSQDLYSRTEQLRRHAENLDTLRIGIEDHFRNHHLERSNCSECEDLKEHLHIASRSSRQHAVETLRAAIIDHRRTRHIARSYCRECEDLQEHFLLAARSFTLAAQDRLKAAMFLVRMADPEIVRSEQQVRILTAAIAHHCQMHQCRDQQRVSLAYLAAN